jgi:NTE family protein
MAFRRPLWLCLIAIPILAGCATRPINAPLARIDHKAGYRYEARPQSIEDSDTLIIVSFSGGGTRAAAFAFGVLEQLRNTPVTVNGHKTTVLGEIDVITGVSGGSFTALAYGLYGDELFSAYEQQFLKRDVQSELIHRFLNPINWPRMLSAGWGRSEMAEEYYDEILFHGATFGDLINKPGPWVMATATDISTGSRLGFTQTDFDLICSDVASVPLARAAAASSAVPAALSPVTLNNYGGTCQYREPEWARVISDPNARSRPAGRALQRLKEMRSFQDSANRPYLHLVDGGVSDNLGMRAILEGFEELEASPAFRRSLKVDSLRRIAVIVVNSASNPSTDWDKSERPPNDLVLVLKATGVPIARYSYESVELLKDLVYRWQNTRDLRAAGAFANAGNPNLARAAASVPNIDVYAIDVSFEALQDAQERTYLMNLPTSFRLPPEAVDRLRAAAGEILRTSPDFKRLVNEMNNSKPPESVAPAIQVR